MKIAVDLDNTLCSPISRCTSIKEVRGCKPYKKIIDIINDLFSRGHEIIIWTHRHTKCKKETIKWLKKYKVNYSSIVFDKLGADLYLDDKALPPYRYLSSKAIEDYIVTIKKWNFDKGSYQLRKSI